MEYQSAVFMLFAVIRTDNGFKVNLMQSVEISIVFTFFKSHFEADWIYPGSVSLDLNVFRSKDM